MVGVYEVGRWGWTVKNNLSDKTTKTLNIHVISDGITRLPILEGEISHIEIPRGNRILGLTIVGGSDTPLRCVVVQEVFPDGLVAQDGRLQPGDQIIEVDGVDMTSATHYEVCQALRKPQPVLRLGVYRERIQSNASPKTPNNQHGEMIAVTLCKESSRQLGLKLSGRCTEPGIFIMEVLRGSVAAQDGRLHAHDRILAINGHDVRYARLDQASQLIQKSHIHVSLIVSRGSILSYAQSTETSDFSTEAFHGSSNHWREEVNHETEFPNVAEHRQTSHSAYGVLDYVKFGSCESLSDPSVASSMLSSPSNYLPSENERAGHGDSRGDSPTTPSPGYYTSDTDDMDPHQQGYHHHQQHPETLYPQEHATPPDTVNLPSRSPTESTKREQEARSLSRASHESNIYSSTAKKVFSPAEDLDFVSGLLRTTNVQSAQLQQKNVRIKKGINENLGMRIGGGIGSNEGDTPIYIANINLQGPVGKCRSIKKGDVLLSVNGRSLLGLTHSQAVALLKATAELASVALSLLDGPETSTGATNFVPSWLYWQKLPRTLHMSKTVILHRQHGASLGFSIVGGADPQRGQAEPIHVLFVVQSSPASLDGKLRCGDRLLSVDGQSLEYIHHSAAVSLLKQAGETVHLEVVSWLGTEL
ncbi:PDZ domain binding [Halocaridina rubra]|uniref:PDZ domain binding n=1 Tax=Halocaridina rubra TaxID=373956 RepID=A0AAN8XVK1_HALRR